MKKENKLVVYIKKVIYVILEFLQSLFKANKKPSIKDEKQIIQERKRENGIKKETVEEASEVTAMPDEPKTETLLPFEKEFTKLFDKQIEEITGIKKKNTTYNELYEINKIKKKLIPVLYQLEQWDEQEMERWMHKIILKEILETKSLPLKEPILNKMREKQQVVEEKTTEEKKIEEPILRTEEQLPARTTAEDTEKVIDVKEVVVKYEEQPKLEQERKTEQKVKVELPKAEEDFERRIVKQTIETSLLEVPTQTETVQVEKEIETEKKVEQKEEQPDRQEEEKESYIHLIEHYEEKRTALERKIRNALETELTIEEYELLQEEIESLQIEISTFIRVTILEDKELEMIKEQQNELRQLKKEMTQQEEKEKKEENIRKEETISSEEISKINSMLQELYQEHENDLKEMNLDKVEELQNKTEEEIKEIEKNLLLLKLSKASKLVGIPTIALLPFVRNPYYATFTAGIFLNNHLHIIDSLYNRKTKEYSPINFNPIKNGGIALDQSITVTEDNLTRVSQIKQQYLLRYPELADNYTFTKSIGKLESNLNSQYDKLLKKKNRFSKTKKKAMKVNKRAIKRKILEKEKTEERNS